jgi:hypothetical protein
VLRSADASTPGLGEIVGVFVNVHPKVETTSDGVSPGEAVGSHSHVAHVEPSIYS